MISSLGGKYVNICGILLRIKGTIRIIATCVNTFYFGQCGGIKIVLKCKPRILPVERDDLGATMTRWPSGNIPSALFQNPSFLEKTAVFKCQDAPEMFTLKFGFWVAKCGWEY